ncbi:MAG: sulfite exporter TauE/SafE family protein [Bacillota bacterium]|nr:sulfite exporter TauE/SafE family protein [Bacillota bacterium]
MVLAGLLTGFLVGLTGVGGGALLTPVLVLLGVPVPAAVGSDLLTNSLTKAVGLWQYGRRGDVAWSWAWAIALPGIPGALAGSWLVGHLGRAPGADLLLHRLLGAALVLSAATNLARLLLPRRPDSGRGEAVGGRQELARAPRRLLAPLGAFIGLMVGLTSVGAGSLVAPLLLATGRLAPREVVGTDIAAAVVISAAAALAHGLAGTVHLGLAACLLAGSLPGVWLGGRLGGRLPARPLRALLSGTVLAVGLAWLR